MPLHSGASVHVAVSSALRSVSVDAFYVIQLSQDLTQLELAGRGEWLASSREPLQNLVNFLRSRPQQEPAYVVLGGKGKRFPLMVLHVPEICSTQKKMAYSASKPPLRKIVGSCTEVVSPARV